MGKLILISGANSSGKSRYAESLVGKTTGPRYYIATMSPQTEENWQRIEKHRHQRQGLDFTTLELPHQVGDAPVPPDAVVLLEDVSNLLGNGIFEEGRGREQVLEDICALLERCSLLVAVTISGLEDEGYSGETAEYIRSLAWLNVQLMERAELYVTMEAGTARVEKGEWDDLL